MTSTEVAGGFRLLVCGDRDWGSDFRDRWLLEQELATWAALYPDLLIIEGEGGHADVMAREWAQERGVAYEPYPAHWRHDDDCPADCRRAIGRAAGPVRNLLMLNVGRPDYVVAFHRDLAASKGTANMVRIARERGVPVRVLP